MSTLPFLSDDEIAMICEPLTRPSAQRRYLADVLKLSVHEKPNGRPLVARSEFERVLGADRFQNTSTDGGQAPNVMGMMAHLAARKTRKVPPPV